MPSNPFKAEPTSTRRALGILGRRVRNLERRLMAGDWIVVGTYPTDPATTEDSPPFQNGAVNSGNGSVTQDQLTRFRWRIGLTGGVEIQWNFTGVPDGLIVWSLPADYWVGAKQTLGGADDNGDFSCITVVPRNDGSGIADVYAGRV